MAKTTLQHIFSLRKLPLIIIPAVVLALLPILVQTPESKCAYAVLLFTAWLIFDVAPIGILGLTPLVVYPALGILKAKDSARYFAADTTFLVVGLLIFGVAVEETKLGRKFGCLCIKIIGLKLQLLLAFVMILAWFLSIWISNTATVLLLLFPCVHGIVGEIVRIRNRFPDEFNLKNRFVENQIDTIDTSLDHDSFGEELNSAQLLSSNRLSSGDKNICRAFYLGIVYAANIGGTVLISSTPTSRVTVGILEAYVGLGISHTKWVAMTLPCSLLTLCFAWLLLSLIFLGYRVLLCRDSKPSTYQLRELLSQRGREIGGLSVQQVVTLLFLIILPLTFLLRNIPFTEVGWGDLFSEGYVTDATATIFLVFWVFVIPFKLEKSPTHVSFIFRLKPILNWNNVTREVNWNVVLLVGAMFVHSRAIKISGLANWFGRQLEGMGDESALVICILTVLLTSFLTEFLGNTTTASILVPIVTSMAERLNLNPIYLAFPVAMCASQSFILPIASSANTPVFGNRPLRVIDMMFAGIFVKLFSIVILLIAVHSWGHLLFDYYL